MSETKTDPWEQFTPRDLLAAFALAGQYAAGPAAWIDKDEKMRDLAAACYRVADAMLQARAPKDSTP